jgi:very-short-patch-repair endonuclease
MAWNSRTKEDFQRILNEKHEQDLTVLGEYKDNETNIEIKHEKCGHTWSPKPMTLTRNNKPTGCPNCANNVFERKTTKKFKKEVYELVEGEYTVLGEYKNNHTNILMRHEKCGHEWEANPNSFLLGSRCPECQHPSRRKTNKEFKKEVKNLHDGSYRSVSKYNGCNKKVKIKHLTCGTIWKIKPTNLLSNKNTCPKCIEKEKDSKAVKKIKDFFNRNNIKFKTERKFSDCRYKRQLRFDFYLPNYNLLLEYDGRQHFKAWYNDDERLKDTRNRDIIKNKWSEENNISLLRINYKNKRRLTKILNQIFIKGSSTTIENYNLYYINEDSNIIHDNNKYIKL